MSSLSDQLSKISSDLSNGSKMLLDLVNPMIKNNDQSSLKEVFTFLGNRSVPQVITNDAVESMFQYISKVKSEKEKVQLLLPVLVYLLPFEAFRQKHIAERDQFIALCQKLGCYYELSQYYLKQEEKNPFPYNSHKEKECLEYVLVIAEACAKAGDKSNASRFAYLARKYHHTRTTPLDLRKKYQELRFTIDLTNQRFYDASNDLFSFYSLDKENPESLDYLRRAAVYSILSNESDKRSQISKLLNEEKMKKLPICELLERISKETIITADEMPKFKAQLENEIGYSDETLSQTILIQNIRAISRFFSSISFQRISQITGEKIEVVLSHLQNLISNQTIKSLIDQPNQFVFFKSFSTEEERKDASISSYCRTLQQFTSQISS